MLEVALKGIIYIVYYICRCNRFCTLSFVIKSDLLFISVISYQDVYVPCTDVLFVLK